MQYTVTTSLSVMSLLHLRGDCTKKGQQAPLCWSGWQESAMPLLLGWQVCDHLGQSSHDQPFFLDPFLPKCQKPPKRCSHTVSWCCVAARFVAMSQPGVMLQVASRGGRERFRPRLSCCVFTHRNAHTSVRGCAYASAYAAWSLP